MYIRYKTSHERYLIMFFVFFLLKMRDSDANGLRRTTLVFSFSYIIDD